MSLFSFFSHRTAESQPNAGDAPRDGQAQLPPDAREESNSREAKREPGDVRGAGGAGNVQQAGTESPASSDGQWPTEGQWVVSWEKTIPSQAAAGKQVLEDILRDLAAMQWSDRDQFGVRLALEEALVNAMKHGNGFDPQKNVTVVCRIAPDLLHVEIQDEGRGFRPEDVPDPTDPDNLEKPSGRGIILMRSFMSSVQYNERGNRVIMEKRRSEEGGEPRAESGEPERKR